MEQFELDVAIEEGDLKTVRRCRKAGYSLYAKQMAMVNGHDDIVRHIKKFSWQRNNTGVVPIHSKYNKETGKREWSDCIPEKFRDRFMAELA